MVRSSQGNLNQDLGPSARGRPDHDGAPYVRHPFPDTDKPQSRGGCSGAQRLLAEADTVVSNAALDGTSRSPEADHDTRGFGVPDGVVHGLLRDAIEDRLHARGEPAPGHAFHRDRHPRPARHSVGERPQRRLEAEVVENRRSHLVGNLAEPLFHGGESLVHDSKLLLLLRGRGSKRVIHGPVHADEEVARLIVDRVRDTLHLLLARLGASPDRRVRLPRPAMGHFERREDLGRYGAQGCHDASACVAVFGLEKKVLRGLDQGRGDVEDAAARFEGFAAQLVGRVPRPLRFAPYVLPEEADESRVNRIRRLGHVPSRERHAARTSASSRPVAYRSITRSAISWARDRVMAPSPKSLVSPSVAMSNRSPRRNGRVTGMSRVSRYPTKPLPTRRLSRVSAVPPAAWSSTPWTFPTPSQVMLDSPVSILAMPIVRPRNSRTARWHRSISHSRGAVSWLLKTSMAAWAAAAASGPCPMPSATASSAEEGPALTT